MISVTPQGFKFRAQVFDTVGMCFKWFKEHFRDPIPGTPSTPRSGVMTNRATTPHHPFTPNVNLSSKSILLLLRENKKIIIIYIFFPHIFQIIFCILKAYWKTQKNHNFVYPEISKSWLLVFLFQIVKNTKSFLTFELAVENLYTYSCNLIPDLSFIGHWSDGFMRYHFKF